MSDRRGPILSGDSGMALPQCVHRPLNLVADDGCPCVPFLGAFRRSVSSRQVAPAVAGLAGYLAGYGGAQVEPIRRPG